MRYQLNFIKTEELKKDNLLILLINLTGERNLLDLTRCPLFRYEGIFLVRENRRKPHLGPSKSLLR